MKNVYSLEMKELPYGLWKSFVRQTSRCVHEVTGLSPDSDYAFRVKTIGDDGDVSSFSSQAFLYRKYGNIFLKFAFEYIYHLMTILKIMCLNTCD